MQKPTCEYPSKVSDQATSPIDMLPVNPPNGTITYCLRPFEPETFGVKIIKHGLIQDNEDPAQPEKYVEGTFIAYEPGGIYAHVARRRLNAEEINRIGELCANIDNTGHRIKFLPDVIARTENVLIDLSTLGYANTPEMPTNLAYKQLVKKLSEMGSILKTMKEAQSTEREIRNRFKEEAYDLGVRLITSKTGGIWERD